MKWFAVIALLLLFLFCLFGFLASFEPTDNAIYFRIGYGTVGLMSLATMLIQLLPRSNDTMNEACETWRRTAPSSR